MPEPLPYPMANVQQSSNHACLHLCVLPLAEPPVAVDLMPSKHELCLMSEPYCVYKSN